MSAHGIIFDIPSQRVVIPRAVQRRALVLAKAGRWKWPNRVEVLSYSWTIPHGPYGCYFNRLEERFEYEPERLCYVAGREGLHVQWRFPDPESAPVDMPLTIYTDQTGSLIDPPPDDGIEWLE